MAGISRLDYALETSLEEPWEFARPVGIPAREAAAWRDNFLRVGIVPARRLAEFREALPKPLSGETSRVLAGDKLAPIPYTPFLRAPAAIQLTIPPFSPQQVTFDSGRLQFLLCVQPDSRGAVLTFVPHHHQPKVSIKPRDPWEKELDGRIYDELALHVRLQAEDVLVIGLPAIPQGPKLPNVIPGIPASQPAAPAPVVQPAPAEAPAAPPPLEPQLPAKLGPLLLSGTRYQKPLQLLLIIRVGPLPTATAPAH